MWAVSLFPSRWVMRSVPVLRIMGTSKASGRVGWVDGMGRLSGWNEVDRNTEVDVFYGCGFRRCLDHAHWVQMKIDRPTDSSLVLN